MRATAAKNANLMWKLSSQINKEMSIYWKKKETFFRIYVHHDAIFIIEYHKIMTLILRDRNGVCVYETSDTNTK